VTLRDEKLMIKTRIQRSWEDLEDFIEEKAGALSGESSERFYHLVMEFARAYHIDQKIHVQP
jgi:hypothetical protein